MDPFFVSNEIATMSKQDQIQFRIHVSHKETLKDWSARLGITLTQLYMILAGQATNKELYKLQMTVFADRLRDKVGIRFDQIEGVEQNKSARRLYLMMLSTAAQIENAKFENDKISLEVLSTNIAQIEKALIRVIEVNRFGFLEVSRCPDWT